MTDDATSDSNTDVVHRPWRTWLGGLLVLAGLAWTAYAWLGQVTFGANSSPEPARVLAPGTVATMDSAPITYSDNWDVTSVGADPPEPSDPWLVPSGVVTFPYSGQDLWLNLAVGDYWAYLYITIDGQPASLLPYIRGNKDSTGAAAGYRTFYEPDKQESGGVRTEWMRVHRDTASPDSHEARIEIWRGWGQTPLRGVAIDAIPPPPTPRWPGVALTLIGLAILYPYICRSVTSLLTTAPIQALHMHLLALRMPRLNQRNRLLAAVLFASGIAIGVGITYWPLAVAAMVGLGVVSIGRPALWTSVLVFALPFYYTYSMPLSPGRSIGLIDSFILVGFGVAVLHRFLTLPAPLTRAPSRLSIPSVLLAAIVGWALVSASAAQHADVALREWRVVFLSAGLFAPLLFVSLRSPDSIRSDLWLIVTAWIAGGTVIATVGLVQYATGAMLITAEGVERIRAFYGSPNNLALYLERTFLVSLALAAFLPTGGTRLAFTGVTLVQAVAIVLTFSKGALLLGIPAGICVLWIGGILLLTKQKRSRRPLLWLAAIGGAIVLILLPFLNTDRFRGMLDLTQGTGYLRLQLWRSSWQMALDHMLLGVGPDNFLYTYRSTYLLPQAWQEPNLNHPHNWILDWWTRIGHPGLVMATALFATTLTARWRNAVALAQARPSEAVLSLGFLAAGIGALTHGFIDASYALPDLMISWILILMAAVALPEPGNSRPVTGHPRAGE